MADTSTITVLFTDMVDSTGLLRAGADVADEIRRRHLGAVRGAVSAHRGVEVKNLGDGVMATFTSAADAVAGATAIQQAVHRLQHDEASSPAVRVGVSTGEATNEEGDWFGAPVIEAARLCAEAQGGQTLVTGVVSLLVAGRGGHAFVPLGERKLKGFEEPVAVCEVAWVPTPITETAPLPAVVELVSGARFVGRATEFDAVLQEWKAVHEGRRRCLLVAGEPGVGKTRLAVEVARVAHEDGATVLWGRCDEDLTVAYQPFVEAVRHWVGWADDDRLAAVAGRGDLIRLLPELGDRLPAGAAPPPGDPEAERQRLFEAVDGMLAAVARSSPVLLVIDDLHWAGTPTLLLLRHVVRSAEAARLLVLCTYRDADLDRAHPLADTLASLRREPSVERVALDGLSVAAVTEFLEAAAGEALGAEGVALAEAIHGETEGNPFFIGQVLRHLTEAGALERVDGHWVMTKPLELLGIPEGVREVVGRRLSRLSADANRVLAVAAVIGRDFDLRTLEAVPDVGGTDLVLDALDEAVAARLVDELDAGRCSFTHALVRQTLLAELTAARRARLHRQVGTALAGRRGIPSAVLAHHFCAGATAGSVDDAVRWSVAASDEARERLAWEEGASLAERALQVLDLDDEPRHAERAMLLTRQSRGIGFSGDSARSKPIADEAIHEARAAGDAVLLGDAAEARIGWGLAGVPEAEAAAVAQEALTLLGDREPRLRASLLGSLAIYRCFNESQGSAAAPLAREAVELVRPLGDADDLAWRLAVLGLILQGDADLSEQLEVLAELRALTARSPVISQVGQVNVARIEAVLAIQQGDRAGLEAAIASVEAAPAGEFPAALAAMWRALVALAEGRFDDAEADANRLLVLAERDVNFQNSWAALLFRIHRERGTAAELLPLVRATAEATPGLVALRCVLAIALVEAGELDEAAAVVASLAPGGFAALNGDPAFTAALAELIDVCAAVGERDWAAPLRALLLPYAGQVLVTSWGVFLPGAADRYLGMLDGVLGDHARAVDRFAAAVALEESIGATALATRTRLWWARALFARGDGDDRRRAVDLLTEVAETAGRLGMAGVEREATQALAATR